MNQTNKTPVEIYITNEIKRLNFKNIIIKTACHKFQLSQDEVRSIYLQIRQEMKSELIKRAWTYVLIGGIFLGVGLVGTFSKTGFIFYGAIGLGTTLLITAMGYFRIGWSR